MKNAILLAGLMLALISTPVIAADIPPATIIPANVRYGLVFTTAQKTCPAALDQAMKYHDRDALDIVDRVIDGLSLSKDEGALLYYFCSIYAEGVVYPGIQR